MRLQKEILAIIALVVILPMAALPNAYAQSNLTFLSTTDYIDQLGYSHVVGEIENTSDNILHFVEISGTLYNSNGQVVDTTFSYTMIDVLRPGERSPFHLIFMDTIAVQQATRYNLDANGQIRLEDKPRNLDVVMGRGHVDQLGYYHLVGEVINNGDSATTFAEVTAAFYDGNNELVDTVFGYTSPETIQAGDSAPFEIISQAPNARDIESVVLNAQSMQYSATPEFPIAMIGALGGIVGAVVVFNRLKNRK